MSLNNKFLKFRKASIVRFFHFNVVCFLALTLTFLCCNMVFADLAEVNTTSSEGKNQIVVSPINMLLDFGEISSVNVLVMGIDGTPIEGREIHITPQDMTKVFIENNSFISDESGYINFTITGKQEGDTIVTVSDGVISSQINVSIRKFIHYILPYYYGNMQLNLINPTVDTNYVKIQFHENSERFIPPIIVSLESKEMKTIDLSENTDAELMDGWVEILSTEIVCGGVWTNKGYLPFNAAQESW